MTWINCGEGEVLKLRLDIAFLKVIQLCRSWGAEPGDGPCCSVVNSMLKAGRGNHELLKAVSLYPWIVEQALLPAQHRLWQQQLVSTHLKMKFIESVVLRCTRVADTGVTQLELARRNRHQGTWMAGSSHLHSVWRMSSLGNQVLMVFPRVCSCLFCTVARKINHSTKVHTQNPSTLLNSDCSAPEKPVRCGLKVRT